MSTGIVSGPGHLEIKAEERAAFSASAALRKVYARIRRLPRWSHMAALTVVLLAAFIAVYLFFGREPAKLRIVYLHNFHAAELSVVVDSDLVYTGSVSGTAKKRFGVFGSASGSFSKTVRVPAGRHAVQVHVSAPADGFDQAKVSYAAFTDEKENVLVINSGRHTGLGMTFQGGATAQPPTPQTESGPYPKSLFSILLSILGTMISASISFLVQEFWRNHRQRIAAGSN